MHLHNTENYGCIFVRLNVAIAWDKHLTAKMWRLCEDYPIEFSVSCPVPKLALKGFRLPILVMAIILMTISEPLAWCLQVCRDNIAHWRGTLLQHTCTLAPSSAKTGSWTLGPGTGTIGLQARPTTCDPAAQLAMALRVCPRQVPSCWFGHINGCDLQPQHGGLKGSGCVWHIGTRWGGATAGPTFIHLVMPTNVGRCSVIPDMPNSRGGATAFSNNTAWVTMCLARAVFSHFFGWMLQLLNGRLLSYLSIRH